MRYLIFLFIPVCVYLAVLPLREAWGHYYYAIHSDPSYLYLFNGLNIATLQPSAHVDNPGTTTQLFSALVIRATALIKGTDDLQKDIILHPEEYIIIINRALFMVCLAALFLFGVFAFRFTGSLWFSLFLQSVPFYSWQLMRIFLKVSPEMMMFIACLLWAATLLRLSAKDDFREHHVKYTVWFGLLTAFSLATKLTMIPFVMIPLIMMPIRVFVNYLLLSFILFHLFIFPAWTHYDYLISWIKNLFQHSSLYGSGDPVVVDFPQACRSFLQLLTLEHPLYSVITAGCILLLTIYSSKSLRISMRHSIDVKILISLVSVTLAQLLMVAKHFNPHYLIPSLMLFTAIIYFTVTVYSDIISREPERLKWIQNISVKSAVLILLLTLLLIRHSVKDLPGISLSEWFTTKVLMNVPLFLAAAVFFLSISLLLKRHPKARRGFLNICIVILAISYGMRHADLRGFRSRLNIEAKESQAVINIIDEHYKGYAIIYGERSSSIRYALKYGANENFSQPHHFQRMKELIGRDACFWDHSDKFKTWTEEITLAEILNQNEKALLECDMRFTPENKLKELEQQENVRLKEVYAGLSFRLIEISQR